MTVSVEPEIDYEAPSQYHGDYEKRVYQVGDLFHTEWKHLATDVHAEVYTMQQQIKSISMDDVEYGILLIKILRALRKNIRLVDKINEARAVDIYNDLAFLNQPWYFFPALSGAGLLRPLDYLSKHSFDQFIYADNEFTAYLVTNDAKYLNRLVATLYTDAATFDKEEVQLRADRLKLKAYELMLVFFTYAHVREFVVKRCKHLLPRTAGADSTPQASGPLWHQIKHQAAATLVFGSFNELGKSNMYDVLDHLEVLATNNKPKKK